MKVEKFLESRPQCHADLIKVEVECSELLLLEAYLIFLVYRKNEEDSKNVIRGTDCTFEMLQEDIIAGSEDRSK